MDITIQASFLPHEDAEASLSFYRDTLGFEVRQDVGAGVQRWITVGPPGQPDTAIVLHPLDKGTTGVIILATHDLDETFARVQAAEAPVVQEPTKHPWGVRDCAFSDPAGNTVRISEVA